MTEDATTPRSDLSGADREKLTALLDTILPASPDGRMPSAADLDFDAYLAGQAAGFLSVLHRALDRLETGFAGQSLPERVKAVEGVAAADPQAFDDLIFRVYDCYYQNDVVRRLIGSEPGPPFPRGNVIPPGDLSSLDDVVKRSAGYRR